MVVDVIDVGRNHLKISVAFVGRDFHVATLYRDNVLALSEGRCSGIVQAGKLVTAKLDRLKEGHLNSQERQEIKEIIARLKAGEN
jgi:ABC-type glutathione transport system ATPase component